MMTTVTTLSLSRNGILAGCSLRDLRYYHITRIVPPCPGWWTFSSSLFVSVSLRTVLQCSWIPKAYRQVERLCAFRPADVFSPASSIWPLGWVRGVGGHEGTIFYSENTGLGGRTYSLEERRISSLLYFFGRLLLVAYGGNCIFESWRASYLVFSVSASTFGPLATDDNIILSTADPHFRRNAALPSHLYPFTALFPPNTPATHNSFVSWVGKLSAPIWSLLLWIPIFWIWGTSFIVLDGLATVVFCSGNSIRYHWHTADRLTKQLDRHNDN